jgi:hypothetical protein
VVFNYLRHSPAVAEEARDRVRKIASHGSRMYRNKEIGQREALSKVAYENALEFFAGQSFRGAEGPDALERCASAILNALRCLKP